jgi:hypothetical protein
LNFKKWASVIAVIEDDQHFPIAGGHFPLGAMPIWLKDTSFNREQWQAGSPFLSAEEYPRAHAFVIEGFDDERKGHFYDGPWVWKPLLLDDGKFIHKNDQIVENWPIPLRADQQREVLGQALELQKAAGRCLLPSWKGPFDHHRIELRVLDALGVPMKNNSLQFSGLGVKYAELDGEPLTLELSNLPSQPCLGWLFVAGQRWEGELVGDEGRCARQQVLLDIMLGRSNSQLVCRIPHLPRGDEVCPEIELLWREQGPLLNLAYQGSHLNAYLWKNQRLTLMHRWPKRESITLPLPKNYLAGETWIFSSGREKEGMASLFQLPSIDNLFMCEGSGGRWLGVKKGKNNRLLIDAFLDQGYLGSVGHLKSPHGSWNRFESNHDETVFAIWEEGGQELNLVFGQDSPSMNQHWFEAGVNDVCFWQAEGKTSLLVATTKELLHLDLEGRVEDRFSRGGFSPMRLQCLSEGIGLLDVRQDKAWVYYFQVDGEALRGEWIALHALDLPLHDHWDWACGEQAHVCWVMDSIEQRCYRYRWSEAQAWQGIGRDIFHDPSRRPCLLHRQGHCFLMRNKGVQSLGFE